MGNGFGTVRRMMMCREPLLCRQNPGFFRIDPLPWRRSLPPGRRTPMDIAIVGAGIAGIATAYELAQDGHTVTVYEQHNAAAEGASFANAGWLSPTLLQPWSTPGWTPGGKQQALVQATGPWLGHNWRWLRRWKTAERDCAKHGPCTPTAMALEQLSGFSQQLRHEITAAHELSTESQQGHLVLLRTAKDKQAIEPLLGALAEMDVSAQWLDADAARALEPGLSPEATLEGALHLPEGETINCRQWTQQLRQLAMQSGVRLQPQTQITALQMVGRQVHLQQAGHAAAHLHDAVVLCTGAAPELLAASGLRLPMMPLHGYTISAPLREPSHAPRAAALDWGQQLVISRIGQRVRISGGAELGSAPETHNQATLTRMYEALNDWFPGAAQLSSPQVQIWRGTRGVMPDGAPLLGRGSQSQIWLNLAHGAHGVSLANGCARLLADLIAGRPVPQEVQALSPMRFSN